MFQNHDSTVDEALFELLANPRRRFLLHHLIDTDGEAHLRKVSRKIVAHETDTEPEDVDDDSISRVYVSLYQTHVPALENHDVVEYDEAEQVVYLGDRTDDIAAVLRDCRERRRQWGRYYVSVALVLGGIVLLWIVFPVPETAVSLLTVGAALALSALAAMHYYWTTESRFDEQWFDDLVS